MKLLILAASAAALTISMPVLAEPGKGGGPKAQHSQSAKGQAKSNRDARNAVRTRTDVRSDRRDRVSDDRRFDRDRFGDRVQNGTNARNCPPGLAKKSPACIPPGQAKRLFNQGQRLPAGFDDFSRYNQIPERFRSQVPYSRDARYIYRDDRVYVVNPTTRLVTTIIDLLR